jgi:hypothetical protein
MLVLILNNYKAINDITNKEQQQITEWIYIFIISNTVFAYQVIVSNKDYLVIINY